MLSSRFLPALLVLSASVALAAEPSPAALRTTSDYVPPELAQLTKPASSELRELVERFSTDREELELVTVLPNADQKLSSPEGLDAALH